MTELKIGQRIRLTANVGVTPGSLTGDEGTIVGIFGSNGPFSIEAAMDNDEEKDTPWPLDNYEFEVIG